MPGGLLLEDAGLAQGQETGAWLTAHSGVAGQDDPRWSCLHPDSILPSCSR
jgi:hypothetical protein